MWRARFENERRQHGHIPLAMRFLTFVKTPRVAERRRSFFRESVRQNSVEFFWIESSL